MKKTKKLQIKILFFFTVFILMLSAVTTVLSVRKSQEVALTIFTSEGESYAKKAVSLIDGDKFEALSKSLDENDQYYEKTRLELYRMWEETSLIYLYTIASYGDGNYLYIIDGSGEKGSETFSALGDEVDPDDYGSFFFETWETKTRQKTPLEKSDWGYLVSVYEPIMNSRGDMVGIIGCDFDAESLYESLKSQIIGQIVLGILFAAAGVGIMFLLVRPIFVRLGSISEILGVLARGEGNLSSRIKIKRNDEIDNMAGLFNETMDRICELIFLIKDQTINLFNVGHELSENMTQTAGAVMEITAGIQKIKHQVFNQSASVNETSATVGQVVGNIDRLNNQVGIQTESVSQSSAAVEEMLANIQSVTNTLVNNAENVEKLISASDIGRTSLEDVSRDIQEIARESEGLLEINSVMQNIAGQTNLLSMNAAIEAAHAGEAGKGFAVVADEIRKLAESSSKQSKTISAVLKKIKESIDKITRSTTVVLEKFGDIDTEIQTVSEQESSIRNAMEEQSVGSKQILESIGRLQEITRQVKGGSSEMLEGIQQVIMGGTNLTTITQEITNDVNEIASGADYINSAVERVHTITENNEGHINALSMEVERFKVDIAAEYTWNKTFSVGHDLIDSQHQELFMAINNLMQACRSGIRTDFDTGVAFLKNYVVKHFSDEEEIQISNEYPDYPDHKKMHENFKTAVGHFSAQWLIRGPTEAVLQDVRAQVGSWLINHIKAQDVKIGAFIRSKKG